MVSVAAMSESSRLRRFYIGVGVLGIFIAFIGFWPSYFGPVFLRAASKATILHLHAVVFVGWLVLFTAQAYFAANRRIDLHVRVGRFGIAYGVAVIVVGLATGYLMSKGYAAAGEADRARGLLYSAFIDIGVFAPLFGAAIAARQRPELHKRLMIVAGTSLLVAAVFRMPFLGQPRNMWLAHGIWFSPVLLTMAHDFVQRRKVHPVLVVGIAALVAQSPIFRPAARATGAWQSFSSWILGISG